jgi:hypothetical protein
MVFISDLVLSVLGIFFSSFKLAFELVKTFFSGAFSSIRAEEVLFLGTLLEFTILPFADALSWLLLKESYCFVVLGSGLSWIVGSGLGGVGGSSWEGWMTGCSELDAPQPILILFIMLDWSNSEGNILKANILGGSKFE